MFPSTDGLGRKRGESPSHYREGTSFSLSAEVRVPADGKQGGQPGNCCQVGRRHFMERLHFMEPGRTLSGHRATENPVKGNYKLGKRRRGCGQRREY